MGRPRLVAGCMCGTSLDGLDAAVVRVSGVGLGIGVEPLGFASAPLGELGAALRDLAEGGAATAEQWARLARELGALHAAVVRAAMDDAGLGAGVRPDLCVAHGQTLHHAPPLSVQLINPWSVASALGCAVVCDLRGADLGAGGQGAPISPVADWVLFRSGAAARAVVNLGGFCNVTVLPPGADPGHVRARDVCACNHVLDAAARAALDRPYDTDGAVAARGTAHADATDELARLLVGQGGAGRSLGTGDEGTGWVGRWSPVLGPADLLASAGAGVGRAIARSVREDLPEGEILLAGGGAKNPVLARAIREGAGGDVRMTDELGIGVQQREAVAMAVLGTLAEDGVAFTLPGVTGRGGLRVREGLWVRGPA